MIGRRLLPQLLAAGHHVTALVRSPSKVAELRLAGAEALLADALDVGAVHGAVAQAAPDAVIHQLTSLPRRINPRTIQRDFVMNDRLRTEGTRILVAAALAAGASRILAQSIAFSYAPGPPGTLHSEDDPLLDPAHAARAYARSAGAVIALERSVLDAGGTVLRYGYFYGPGSAISSAGSIGEDVARRRLPILGDGGGVWSFVHVDDAASATVAALDRDGPTVYNVVDDDPAPVAEWLPTLALALGAPPPRRVPAWLALPLAGRYGVHQMTRAQGASGARITRELGWTPSHASWRRGFHAGLG